jgi:hypothetical protein
LQVRSISSDHQARNTAPGTQIDYRTSNTVEGCDERSGVLDYLRDRPIP